MVLSHKYLLQITRDIFKACGTPNSEAEIVAEHLVTSSLMGLDSHGIIRIPQYVNAIKEGIRGSSQKAPDDYDSVIMLTLGNKVI